MDATITVRCVCGWETTGPTEDVVAATNEHGLRIHNMAATREQILAMAVATPSAPADTSVEPGAGGGTARR